MNRIRELRNLMNLSQSELAKVLGCNQTAVGKYERGELEPNIQTLITLSKFFQVSVGYLLAVEDDLGNITTSTLSPGETLSADEKTMLNSFRNLGPFEREAILIQIQALAGESVKIKR